MKELESNGEAVEKIVTGILVIDPAPIAPLAVYYQKFKEILNDPKYDKLDMISASQVHARKHGIKDEVKKLFWDRAVDVKRFFGISFLLGQPRKEKWFKVIIKLDNGAEELEAPIPEYLFQSALTGHIVKEGNDRKFKVERKVTYVNGVTKITKFDLLVCNK